jgi:hypothetical protein
MVMCTHPCHVHVLGVVVQVHAALAQLLEPPAHGVQRLLHRAVVRQTQRAVRQPHGGPVAQSNLEPGAPPLYDAT